MPFLSPAKLLVIVVIGLVVLGPDKLPKVAKQIGGLWADFRRFRQQLESDVRSSFPDLPSTEALTRAVRSPLSFLDTLAESHGAADGASAIGADEVDGPDGPTDGTQPSSVIDRADHSEQADPASVTAPEGDLLVPGGIGQQAVSHRMALPDDPGLN